MEWDNVVDKYMAFYVILLWVYFAVIHSFYYKLKREFNKLFLSILVILPYGLLFYSDSIESFIIFTENAAEVFSYVFPEVTVCSILAAIHITHRKIANLDFDKSKDDKYGTKTALTSHHEINYQNGEVTLSSGNLKILILTPVFVMLGFLGANFILCFFIFLFYPAFF